MRERGGLSYLSLLAGVGLGAGLMFVLDPDRGRRRRAVARDRLVRLGHDAVWHANKQARNAGNHVVGTIAEYGAKVRDRFRGIDDEQLVRRVAAQVGHVVSHPGSLGITAEDGRVTISGPILRSEVDTLKKRLDETRGIRQCELQLDIHDSDENVPGLQGTSRWQRKRGGKKSA
jgi:hypothetical protein